MPCLIVNPGTPSAWEIRLKPGTNTLGRSPANDFVLEHPSVSGAHCQISVGEGATDFRDLGSTNGSFLDGAPVRQARLRPGQVLRLGAVELLFQDEPTPEPAGATPSAEPPLPPPVPGSLAVGAAAGASPSTVAGQYCRTHPKSPAAAYCPQCRRAWCLLCVNLRPVAGRSQAFCRACGSACELLPQAPAHLTAPAALSFWRRVPEAFRYPFQGVGPIFLALYGVVFPAFQVLSVVLAVGGPLALVGILLGYVLGYGFLYATLQHWVICTAHGEGRPGWPDVTSVGEDLLGPLFRFVSLSVLLAGPAVALEVVGARGHAWADWLAVGAWLLAGFHFPMAFLAVAMFDSLAAVNPLLIVPSIWRVAPHYLIVVLVLGTAAGVRLAGEWLLVQVAPVWVALGVSSLGGAYLLAVLARLLGVLYLADQERLGWFHWRTGRTI